MLIYGILKSIKKTISCPSSFHIPSSRQPTIFEKIKSRLLHYFTQHLQKASVTMAAPSSSYQNSKRKPSYNNNKNDGSNKKPKVDLSSLSSSKQKRVLKQERQSHRRHATVVKDSKEVWSKLRLKNNTPEQIKPLQEKLLELLFENGDSTICEIALQHDASRVVQAAIQFASPAERLLIATALAPQLPEMSKVQYAHFCVLKLIQYGHMKKQNECVAVICKVRTE